LATNNKYRVKQWLEIDLDGRRYKGQRVIEGTLKLDQYVVFEQKCIADLQGYTPEQRDTVMLGIAKQLLWELVSGRTMSSQYLEKFNLQLDTYAVI
jgi:hypothetical protein